MRFDLVKAVGGKEEGDDYDDESRRVMLMNSQSILKNGPIRWVIKLLVHVYKFHYVLYG